MKKAWQKLPLDGGGLQAVNAVLTQNMRSRTLAYLAWIGFPAGLHRWYLHEFVGALVYIGLSLLFLIAVFAAPPYVWLLPAIAMTGFALFDLYWIDGRVVAYNKALRIQLFLRKGQQTPTDYQGRYTDSTPDDQESEIRAYSREKEQERAGHRNSPSPARSQADQPSKRAPSFNEQEAMLRELHRRKSTRKQHVED